MQKVPNRGDLNLTLLNQKTIFPPLIKHRLKKRAGVYYIIKKPVNARLRASKSLI